MKNLTTFLLLVCTLFSFTIDNKMVHITGTVVDENNEGALAYATISILDAENKNIISGATTDESGFFKIKIPSGNYDIHVEYLSFKKYQIENKTINADFAMGIIKLKPDARLLEGVEVVEERSSIEYKLDKKVFNVGKDILANGGNVTDVLDNVPSVNVDAAGTISLRGNANVRILIDGKPSVLATNGGLEQLPADMVAQVEVITNPSARYEASGTAGIINVVLKKNKRSGFGGSLQLSTGYPAQHRANVNMNYKTKSFNVFSNIGYRYANFFGDRTRKQIIGQNEVSTMLEQDEEQKRNDDHYNFYIGGDYYFNEKNTLTLSYYNDRIVNTDEMDINYRYLNKLGEVDSILSQREAYREPQNFNELEIDYVKTFTKKGRKFSTSLVYDFWNDDENESIVLDYTLPANKPQSRIVTRDIESSKDLLIQSDFVTPLPKNARLEAGFRGEIRRISSEYTASLNEEALDAFDNLLHYDERIYGAYLQFGKKYKKFNYLLGL